MLVTYGSHVRISGCCGCATTGCEVCCIITSRRSFCQRQTVRITGVGHRGRLQLLQFCSVGQEGGNGRIFLQATVRGDAWPVYSAAPRLFVVTRTLPAASKVQAHAHVDGDGELTLQLRRNLNARYSRDPSYSLACVLTSPNGLSGGVLRGAPASIWRSASSQSSISRPGLKPRRRANS